MVTVPAGVGDRRADGGNLPDRAAAETVGKDLAWQYALGLAAGAEGFDHTVLSEYRARVAGHGLEQVVLDKLLERLASDGLIKAGGKQRTDSTHVIAAVAALHRLELAGESVRAVLEAWRRRIRTGWSRGSAWPVSIGARACR